MMPPGFTRGSIWKENGIVLPKKDQKNKLEVGTLIRRRFRKVITLFLLKRG